MLWLLLAACDLESIGIYECDAYCEGVSGKAEECAAAEGLSFEEFAGAEEATVLATCQDAVDDQGKTDAQCQLETGTLNNSSCDQIASLIGGM